MRAYVMRPPPVVRPAASIVSPSVRGAGNDALPVPAPASTSERRTTFVCVSKKRSLAGRLNRRESVCASIYAPFQIWRAIVVFPEILLSRRAGRNVMLTNGGSSGDERILETKSSAIGSTCPVLSKQLTITVYSNQGETNAEGKLTFPRSRKRVRLERIDLRIRW